MSDGGQLIHRLLCLRSRFGIAALLFGFLAASAACSETDLFSETGPGSGGGIATANGGSSSGGAPSTGGAPNTGGAPSTVSTGGDGGEGGEETCLDEVLQPEPIELHMILVVDRSGSMGSTVSGYWPPTVNALKAFFDDPNSAGVSVGLNMFPHPVTGNNCDPANWNPTFSPGGTNLALLPNDAQTLKTALDANPPTGVTPMYGALDGSYQFAVAHQVANPDSKVIVVVAGDGAPCCGDCSSFYGDAAVENISGPGGVAALAATNYNTHGLETYTISIDPSVVAPMDEIAQQGGTVQTYDVSQNINLFAAKMQEIRFAAIGCEYVIPDPSSGTFDPLDVNVIFTPDAGGDQDIPRVSTSGDCGSGAGWFYDDNVNPTKVTLCPASCALVENDPNPTINLNFGCPDR